MRRKKRSRADLIKFDPHLSPRWRYERALKLAKAGEASKRNWDDKPTDQLRKLLADWLRVQHHTRDPNEVRDHLLMLYSHDPGLYYAFETFQFPHAYQTKIEVEARILARQDDLAVSSKVHTQPEMVEWYEKLFFNIRERLGSDGYIRNQVIWPSIVGSLEEVTFDMTYKFFGYFGGAVVLDHVMSLIDKSTSKKPMPGATTGDFLLELYKSNIALKTAQGVTFMEVNKFNVIALMEQFRLLQDQLKKAEEEGTALDPLEHSIKAFLESLQWCVGQTRQTAIAASPYQPYYGHAGELRAHEIARISQGQVLDIRPDLMRGLPPPPVKEMPDHGGAAE